MYILLLPFCSFSSCALILEQTNLHRIFFFFVNRGVSCILLHILLALLCVCVQYINGWLRRHWLWFNFFFFFNVISSA